MVFGAAIWCEIRAEGSAEREFLKTCYRSRTGDMPQPPLRLFFFQCCGEGFAAVAAAFDDFFVHAGIVSDWIIPIVARHAERIPRQARRLHHAFLRQIVQRIGVEILADIVVRIVRRHQIAPGHWRALVYSTTNGPIPPGVFVRLNFAVATNAPDATVPLVMSDAVVSKLAGQAAQPLTPVDGLLTISSSERLVSTPLGLDGRLRTTIAGPAGRTFTLQGSPDLFHWANLSRHTNQTGTLMLTSTPPSGRTAYFYRTALLPGTNTGVEIRPSLSHSLLLPDGRVRFQQNSPPGSAWRIEGSPDLLHWANYGTMTNPAGNLAITNTPFAKPNVYFHRVAKP